MLTINSEIIATLARASHDAYGSVKIDVTDYASIDQIDDFDTGFSLTIYKSISKESYIFAFRGTEKAAQDVFADLTLGMQQWSDDNRSAVAAKIINYTAGKEGAEIHFTGHSLGGALAQYAAYEYATAISDPENEANLEASFDLVTFNALGGELALADPELYSVEYDAALAGTIDAVHFKIAGDLVSRLGDDHIGGELLVIDKYFDSPFWSHNIAHFTTGVPGNYPVTAAQYETAVVENNYLAVRQPVHVSGIVASWGDDGQYTEEEALLRTISAFSFGLANADYGDLGELVAAFFGDPDSIGQENYDALVLMGETAFIALQNSQIGVVYTNGVGAYALTLANVLQFSSQLWEEHPEFADALGMTIDGFIENVAKPAANLATAALDYALEYEFIAAQYQDSVDFITNTGKWIGDFFAHQPVNGMFIQGTQADDVLSTRDSYWPWKTNDDQIFGFAGDDSLEGGQGNDFLVGGAGADTYIWNTGDSNDIIGDYDDGADRILVNGVDLAGLEFKRISAGSPFYRDATHADITLHYDGSFLGIAAGAGSGGGTITAKEFQPVAGANYGIDLGDYQPNTSTVTDIAVVQLGTADDEIDSSAYWREQSSQGGFNWPSITIRFNAGDVSNYSGGALHGTSGGAFEGGPLGDYLTGDADSNALHGLAGADILHGEAGDDFLEGGAGDDVLFGGDGNDILFGSARAGLPSVLDTGSAADQFYLSQIADEAEATNNLDGGAGDDYVSGGEYTDYIAGGPGIDYLLGGAGNDYIGGGDDRDIIYGDSTLHYRYVEQTPGVASERLEIAFAEGVDPVGQYDDELRAGGGNDTVWGELGNDVIYGGDGDDNLFGDRIDSPDYFSEVLPAYGSSTAVLAIAMHGDDRLYGGAGSDLIMGHAGNDLLAGGQGADSLLGGEGDDTYVYQPGGALDYVQDSLGTHTLLFSNIDAKDLQVVFQGDQVLVGPGGGAEGFQLSRSEWPNTRIALDSPDTVIARSRLDTYYLDSAGNPLVTVLGASELTEADRDAVFTVDATDPGKPGITVGAGADALEIEALGNGSEGAVMRIGVGALQLVVNLAARQIATGLDFLDIVGGPIMTLVGFAGNVFGSDGADRIIGSDAADVIRAGGGDDAVEGRDGNDTLKGESGSDTIFGEGGDDTIDGGSGRDVLFGGEGSDYLYGGQSPERDYLEGGRDDDVLDGGYGPDHYRFNPGDGLDLLKDPSGYNYFEFDAGVDPQSVVLYYTGSSVSGFRFEYGPGDAVSSAGVTSAHWINGVTIGGDAIPLVQRSDLEDGSFHDTRWNDVIEGGVGNDTVFAAGWGQDVYRFSTGDGQDIIETDNHYYPEFMGEISFTADVDLDSLSFSFQNGAAVITYADGDQITVNTDAVFSMRDNVIGRYTLVSEAEPGWMPVVRAQGYVGNLYGSFGGDHIIGGDNIETILPGYGDDIIEAGGGSDSIVLNDVYFYSSGGIGHKDIFSDGGNDIVETPLHQGLRFHYQLGDGHDTIAYDWSYSGIHPYIFAVDPVANTVGFTPYGQDTLVFGDGITLADLRFVRAGDALDVSLLDGSGSIRLPEFFLAWDAKPPTAPPPPPEEGQGPDSLLDPLLVGLLPRSPLANIGFADGSVYDMATVLDSFLEVSTATLLGTGAADTLYGTQADDVIQARGGDDYIEDFGGSNTIDAGAGDDRIEVGSDNLVEPGPGNDYINIAAGDNVVRFGPGSGQDSVELDVDAGTLVIDMLGDLTPADITVTMEDNPWGQSPLITVNATGDTLAATGLRYDPVQDQWSADPGGAAIEVRFADGTVIAGSELFAMAQGPAGELIEGARGRDLLIGTEGDDTLMGYRGRDTISGAMGDDVIIGGRGRDIVSGGLGDDSYVFAAGDGRDVINNDDTDLQGTDILRLDDVDYDQVWLSRNRRHLLLNIAGSADRVRVNDWFVNEEDQLDAIYAGDRVLMRDQVDRLVNAMAAFDVPSGVGAIISDEARVALEPTLASVWRLTG